MKPLQYWDFLARLNIAIERVASRSVAGDIDYSGAIARLLYTTAVNDPWMRAWFAKVSGESGAPPRWVFSTFELMDLTRQLLADFDMPKVAVIGIPTRNWFIKRAYSAASILAVRHALKSLLADKANVGSADPDRRAEVLAFSHQRKFVGLMKPMLARSGLSFAFVVKDHAQAVAFGLDASDAVPMPAGTSSRDAKGKDWPEIHYFARRVEAAIQQYRPKLLLYCEGDAWYQDVVSRMGNKYGVPSVCVQWGAFPYTEPRVGLRNLASTQYLTWGDFFSSQLQPFNPEVEFVACGHPGMEMQSPQSVKKRLIFLLNTNPQGLFSGLDYFHAEFWALLVWTAKKFGAWDLVVRAHPNIPLTDVETQTLAGLSNVLFHDPNVVGLRDSLMDCDLAITVSSSAVIEAVSHGAIPFVLNPAPWSFQPDFEANGAGFECKNLAEAKEELRQILEDPDKLQHLRLELFAFRESLFDCTGEDALTKMANMLVSKVQTGSVTSSFPTETAQGE